MNQMDKNSLMGQEISLRIKQRMKSLGLTNRDLGERISLTEPSVKKLLSGGSSVQFVKLRRLAEALETTPNHLLGVSETDGSSAERSRALLGAAIEAALRTLGDLKQEHAQALTQAILSIPDKPAIVSADLDEEAAARTRAEIAAQEYLPLKN
jgi:transcriptional regulator with XRE-family HTH domain